MLKSKKHANNLTKTLTEENWRQCLAASAIEIVIKSGGRPGFLRNIKPAELQVPSHVSSEEDGNVTLELETAKQANETGLISMSRVSWQRFMEVGTMLCKYL